MNQIFKKKFQVFDDYTGKKCYEVLPSTTGSCAVCEKLPVKQGEFLAHRVYINTLGAYLRSNSTIHQVNGREILMTKFFLTAHDEQQVIANETFEEAMTKCIEVLAMTDQGEAINGFLNLLCEFYASQYAYIWEFDSENACFTNKYLCHREQGESPVFSSDIEEIFEEYLVNYLQNDNKHQVITLNLQNVDGKTPSTLKILQEHGMSNLVLNKLWHKDGSLMGIIGMSNLTKPMFDDRLLKAISHTVMEKFNEQSLRNALNSLNEMDLLTGFYNRNKYAEKLEELHQNPPKQLGILFVNLNGLRKTNEYFGFEVGDEQIKGTSLILREFFADDFYRISGDEFVAFLCNVEKEGFEEKVSLLHTRLKTDNSESAFALGHAWGAGSYSVTDLVKVADTVMTVNKQAFYSSNFSERKEIGNILLQELLQAIVEDEFLVYLQPQLNLATETVVAAEALIRRFDKKQQKMIFPDQFIPLYEKNSIIRHVDLFVVRKVCQLLQEWKHYGKTLPISVNLSRVTLMEHGIVDTISDIVDEYQIPSDLIVIEITERIGLVENEVTSSLVENFKAKGFRLSLDDFGCAYSNIITLAQIDVDEVKIDKSLMDNVLSNTKNNVIVKNILSMCNDLGGTSTLAEGIETEEQAEFLRLAQCEMGQGYLYSRPIPNEEFFEKYIQK
ncbi:MAG: GGDEF domain-containing phosphodiesterase [Eubacteriales bacterium]